MTSATQSDGTSSVLTTQTPGPDEFSRHTPAAVSEDRSDPPLVRVDALTKVYGKYSVNQGVVGLG